MRILYLYSGSRKDKFYGKIGVDYPDTQFYGLNHLGKFGISAEYKEFSDVTKNRFLNKFLNFRIKHLLLYPFIKGYDIVFGSSILYLVILKKIFRPRAKFILLNIGITRTISANQNKKMKLRIISWLMKELDAVVCLSHTQKDYLEKNYPFLKGKVFFVPLGVDINYYQPKYEGRKDYILSAGRDNGRDYKTVIEVARLMPEKEFQIVCSRRNLKGISDTPENVKIFYDLTFSELHKKYQEASMLLLLTHDDSFQDGADCSGQTVLLDAMANGLPLIASRKKYLEDYAEDGKDILLVPFYNPDGVIKKIKIFGDRDVRLWFAKNARNKLEKFFSTEKMAQNLAEVFNII